MTMQQTIPTGDIDQAAYLSAKCGTLPADILRDTATGQVVFEYEATALIHEAIVEFATGQDNISARRLLAIRRRLYHEVRRIKGGGR